MRLGKVDVGHQAAQGAHGRLAAQRLQVGADEAVGDRRQPVQVHVVGQRHAPGVDLEDLAPAIAVGDADGDLAVEAARAAQGRVQRVGDVGGGDDDDVAARFQAVHQGQELGHHAALHLAVAAHLLALGRDGVDLVDEDDGRGVLAGVFKKVAAGGLRTRRTTCR